MGSTRSSDAAAPAAVSTSLRKVMPLNSRATSNLPESTGDRLAVADGAAVGVGEDSSARVIVQRQRSSEIQRNVTAANNAKKMRRTIRRRVPSPNFRTRLFPQPGRDRDNNSNYTQHRHQPCGHYSVSAEKLRNELPG